MWSTSFKAWILTFKYMHLRTDTGGDMKSHASIHWMFFNEMTGKCSMAPYTESWRKWHMSTFKDCSNCCLSPDERPKWWCIRAIMLLRWLTRNIGSTNPSIIRYDWWQLPEGKAPNVVPAVCMEQWNSTALSGMDAKLFAIKMMSGGGDTSPITGKCA